MFGGDVKLRNARSDVKLGNQRSGASYDTDLCGWVTGSSKAGNDNQQANRCRNPNTRLRQANVSVATVISERLGLRVAHQYGVSKLTQLGF